MKKSLVALAALAASAAFAQSSVTITGIMDANYSAIANVGGQTTNLVNQSGARTSTLKFIGVEDLGGGVAADFQLEVQPLFIANDGNKFNTVTTTAAAVNANGTAQGTGTAQQQSGLTGKGMSFIGLSDASLGKVRFGTINTSTFETFAAVSALGTGIGSGYGAGNTLGDFTRVENAVAYNSPVINGFSVGVLKGTGNDSQYGVVGTTGTSLVLRRNSQLDMGATYTNGPLTVKYAALRSTASTFENTRPGVTTTTKLLGGAYDAGVAKVSLATGSISNDAATATPLNAKVNIAAVTVPFMGSYRFIAQTSGVRVDNGHNTTWNAGGRSKTNGLALEKDMSKRTFVYLRLENTDLSGYAATTAVVNGANVLGSANWAAATLNGVQGVDPTRRVTAVGISHQF
jgi:predicted porin